MLTLTSDSTFCECRKICCKNFMCVLLPCNADWITCTLSRTAQKRSLRICMYACMGFTALITNMVLCARYQYYQFQWVGYMSFSRLLYLRAEESYVLRRVKLSCCVESSRKPHALSWNRNQAIVCFVLD